MEKKMSKLKQQRSPEKITIYDVHFYWPRTRVSSLCLSLAETEAVRHVVAVGGVGQFAGRFLVHVAAAGGRCGRTGGGSGSAAAVAVRDEAAVDLALLGDSGGGAGADHDGGGDRRGVRQGVRRARPGR